MAELLYHSDGDTESPFDAAILRVARSGPVRIVSPYIGVTYLQRIISVQSDWRLLSDVQEWLRALSTRDRPKAWTFIRENLSQIHHVPDLHAKAVIAIELAMMGSANLTQKGILGRTELGVMVDDAALVSELHTWFDGIWSATAPPLVDEASAFVQWLDEEAAQAPAKRQRFALSSDSRKVRARLVKLEAPKAVENAPANAPLDLGVVAQAVIVEDQRRYDSLEAALEAAIDKLAAGGTFSFGQVAAETRKGFAGSNLREVYYLLVQHCANHVRSVYVEETQNRLILADDLFAQSAREALPGALEPFAAFLELLVAHLDFELPDALPSFADIENETGFADCDQGILVSQLVDAGFLLEEDRSGDLPWYQLADSFDGWEKRYKLFPRAYAAWDAKRRLSALPRRLMSADDIEPPIRMYGVLRDDQLPEFDDGGEDLDFAALEKEIAAGAAAHHQLATRDAVEAARRKHKKQVKEAARSPALLSPASKPQVQAVDVPHETKDRHQVDALLARLLQDVSKGSFFIAQDWHSLVRLIATSTQTAERIVGSALDPVQKHPQMFLVGMHGKDAELRVNPALKWEMLLRYPKTRGACEKLLGA